MLGGWLGTPVWVDCDEGIRMEAEELFVSCAMV